MPTSRPHVTAARPPAPRRSTHIDPLLVVILGAEVIEEWMAIGQAGPDMRIGGAIPGADRQLFLWTKAHKVESQGDEATRGRRALMKRPGFHDDEERDLITAYERGEFTPVEDQFGGKQAAVQAARRYLRKDARVNI